MNLRFNKKKNIISFSVVFILLLFIASVVSQVRAPLLDSLRSPLSLFTLIQRELGAIIFYHRNFTQNERLKKEVDLLKNKLNAQREVYLENARLKGLLSLKQNSKNKLIAARVIAHSPDSWSSSIIIDKGSYNGIKPGMSVITYLGLAGRVIEAQKFTSKILLINDPNLSVSAVVQRSRQEGLVSGTLGSYLIMRYLPQGSDIKINDLIVTAGLGEVYPKGLLIGKVIDIGNEFSGLSCYALIEPVVNPSNIEEVLVIGL